VCRATGLPRNPRLPPEIDTGVAHSARVYDYLLGGKDNFAADREVGDALTAAMPPMPLLVRDNRAFLGRAVVYLAREAGIRQFLDIGTGIPTGATPTRWRRQRRRTAGSSTSTTTRSCSRTRGR
jgi:S-adenosyl methyltransferase